MKIWTALASGLWLCCWLATTNGFMDINFFEKEIRPNCYGRDDSVGEFPNGQKLPIPNTLESFLSLAEKIEHSNQNLKLIDVVKILLVNFRYDDLMYSKKEDGYQSRTSGGGIAFDILKEIFSFLSNSASKLPDDTLTQDEKCALYFMISHTVNGTIRPNIDEIVPGGDNKPPVIKHPREQGVVMLNSDINHAFALGKVLLGLFAGLSTNIEVESKTVYDNMKPRQPTEALTGDKINLLYAATFGDLISVSKESLTSQEAKIFLPNGEWNDETCPTEYQLAAEDEYDPLNDLIHTTYSSIRGAIDGYMFGSVITDIVKAIPEIRLSQALRSFYGVRGLSFNGDVSTWCFRQRYKDMTTDLQRLALPYDKLFSAVRGKSINEGNINDGILEVIRRMNAHERQIITLAFEASDYCRGSSSGAAEYDTNSDIIAIVDYKASLDQQETQRKFIGELTNGMQMSMHGSSASVYTNLKPYSGTYLDNIINGSTYSGCASCALKHNIRRTGGSKTEAEVFRDLNRTLGVIEAEDTTDEHNAGVPAKVVLYFNYGNVNDDWQTRSAVDDFQRQHRDVTVFAFGVRKENLKVFVDDPDKDIETTFTDAIAKKLKEKVCKTPALFQYKNCHRRTDTDEMNNRYEGFISPNTIQYWAMYPEYFLKSFNIKLTFKVFEGTLKVCFSRYYGNIFEPKENKGDCRETSVASDNTVEFYVKNPCHKYTEYNCRPFYFYIEEKTRSKSSTDKAYCTDERCKTIDQVRYEFMHEGVQCSKGSFLTCTTSTIFYAIVAAIFWLFSTAKGH